MKMITIGRIAVACFTKPDIQAEEHQHFIADQIIHEGMVGRLSDKAAMKFCGLHKNFLKYRDDAMATLWKGGGIYAGGTEDVVAAVKSLLPKGTVYIIVYKAILDE